MARSRIIVSRRPGGGGGGAGVSSLAESGEAALTGAVTLSEGAGIALTQAGQDIEIASTVTGASVLSTTVVGAGGAANVDLTAISQAHTHLRLLILVRTERADPLDELLLRFNNDSGNNYEWNRWFSNTAGSAESNVAVSAISLAYVTGDTATANYATRIVVDIPFYTQTAFFQGLVTLFGHNRGTTTALRATGTVNGHWLSANAISRITLLSANGADLKEGTRVILYGLS